MEEHLSTIQMISVMALPLVFAIVFHEVAHGWVANKLGDPTARNMGRLTLNPLRHIDPFGTVIMPLLLLLLTDGRFVFGYAKPVPINPYNFKDPKKGMALSSLAGPGVNMIMAMSFAFVLRFVMPALEGPIPKPAWDWFAVPVALMLGYGVIVNVVLAVLNMIPVPPLDGSRIVYWLLPDRQAAAYYRLERFGMLILLALLGTGIIARVITPIIRPILFFLLGENIF
ncbi:MAG TPA: site-2 protease family protein [Nitrospirota bacterium]|nr:site-2 protease family protein [Nitrospirota bacterium]